MDIYEKLAAPFAPEHVDWRIQSSGFKNDKVWAIAIAYIDNRAIQQRLDEAVGVGNWQDRYEQIEGGFLCGIGIKFDGEWVWKWDGADRSDIEAIKGGLSGAEKRAAVKWGIGRYLYDLKETFVETTTERNNQWNRAVTSKDPKKEFWWKTPQLPSWALPKPEKPAPPAGPVKCAEFLSLSTYLQSIGIGTPKDATAVINFAVADVGPIGDLYTMAGECKQIEKVLRDSGMTGKAILEAIKAKA